MASPKGPFEAPSIQFLHALLNNKIKLPYLQYADDTQLYNTTSPGDYEPIQALVNAEKKSRLESTLQFPSSGTTRLPIQRHCVSQHSLKTSTALRYSVRTASNPEEFFDHLSYFSLGDERIRPRAPRLYFRHQSRTKPHLTEYLVLIR